MFLKIKLATEWQSVPVMDTMMKVVCRASNRIFVGLPLCTCLSIISLFFWNTVCPEKFRRQRLGFCRPQCQLHNRCYKDGFHSSNGSSLFETASHEISFFYNRLSQN